MPKDESSVSREFYQEAYSEGFTTDCPSDRALSCLVSKNFSGSEKDFQGYIAVLKALGLAAGDLIMDFGASWGYGSWQFRRSGFRAVSYEISKPRAEYAKTKLCCNMIESLDEMKERVKCLFSAHVIEHLANPSLIWEVAQKVLTDEGVVVCFCPNGEPARESLNGLDTYDKAWGRVHPMLITPRFLETTSSRFGFHPYVYSSPYKVDKISDNSSEAEITGDELCLVAKRN